MCSAALHPHRAHTAPSGADSSRASASWYTRCAASTASCVAPLGGVMAANGRAGPGPFHPPRLANAKQHGRVVRLFPLAPRQQRQGPRAWPSSSTSPIWSAVAAPMSDARASRLTIPPPPPPPMLSTSLRNRPRRDGVLLCSCPSAVTAPRLGFVPSPPPPPSECSPRRGVYPPAAFFLSHYVAVQVEFESSKVTF